MKRQASKLGQLAGWARRHYSAQPMMEEVRCLAPSHSGGEGCREGWDRIRTRPATLITGQHAPSAGSGSRTGSCSNPLGGDLAEPRRAPREDRTHARTFVRECLSAVLGA